ncbi:hypothetical protein HDU91_006024 [Kappamyces sp. JEL0680]|nr:hypothetical protein HDU91_006024 [Kappamyces sp. JEL0680]
MSQIQDYGYRCTPIVVTTPSSLGFVVPQPFKWPVPENETNLKNKEAYLAYMQEIVNPFSRIIVRKKIEAPGLTTTIGINPHNVTGDADLYIYPKKSGKSTRNTLCAVVELKPNQISSANLSQAVGYVAAANSLFDQRGYPSPVGILSDFADQWTLIWPGNDNEIIFAEFEDADGKMTPLTRGTALHYLREHLARYNQILTEETPKKRKADEPDFDDADACWAFGDFKAGRLKKMRLVAEDNMRDLIEDEEELRFYDMRKRMENTPLFQIPPFQLYSEPN